MLDTYHKSQLSGSHLSSLPNLIPWLLKKVSNKGSKASLHPAFNLLKLWSRYDSSWFDLVLLFISWLVRRHNVPWVSKFLEVYGGCYFSGKTFWEQPLVRILPKVRTGSSPLRPYPHRLGITWLLLLCCVLDLFSKYFFFWFSWKVLGTGQWVT